MSLNLDSCMDIDQGHVYAFQVESDVDFISGKESLTVLPGKTGQYEACIKPLRRGHYKGVISFVAAPNPVKYESLYFL